MSGTAETHSGAVIPAAQEANSPGRFPALLADFRQRLEADLVAWLGRRTAQASSDLGPAVRELTDRLEDLVARGGKRLRPALIYYAYRGCGGSVDSQVLPAAMASELFHSYLLVHDDIMDRAETRRGAPAAHRAFAGDHAKHGWPGDSNHHGEAVAILLGDLAHSYAIELFLSTRPTPESWPEVHRCFTEMCQEVVLGQYLEVTAPFRADHTEEELLEILRMKSGRYSVEQPILIGAQLAGAAPAMLDGLSRYGEAAGEAFQLKDDLLGVFGDLDAVGKPVGGDLKEGKYTVLIHHTLQAAPEAEAATVREMLGNERAGAAEIAAACDIIESAGARARVERMVAERLKRAAVALEGLDLEPDGRDFFAGLLRYLEERDR